MSAGAVFFDRDGTLIEEVNYLDSLDKVNILPGVAAGIRLLNELEMKVVVISNQSGVARGYFSADFVRQTHTLIAEALVKQGAHIDAFYFCPHHPSAGSGEYLRECECRKPAPGMILQAARDWDVDVKASFVVGDNITDMQAADAVGAMGILVLTGQGESFQGCGYPFAADAAAAATMIARKVKLCGY